MSQSKRWFSPAKINDKDGGNILRQNAVKYTKHIHMKQQQAYKIKVMQVRRVVK
jgi:hypothetical protein